jgi:23S rRNA-/tRNA-specific pseudouridylate synthase
MEPKSNDYELAHVDAHCIVAVKPSGLLSVPGRGEQGRDCLITGLRREFDDALVVHRLDMATSGLMLFARDASTQRALSIAFAQREIHKRYIAVVHGLLELTQGEIDLPLIADWPNRPRQRVDKDCGKQSLTRFRVLEADKPIGTTRLVTSCIRAPKSPHNPIACCCMPRHCISFIQWEGKEFSSNRPRRFDGPKCQYSAFSAR